jgi:hypothetical protein
MTFDKLKRLVQFAMSLEEKLRWLQIWNLFSFEKENEGICLEALTKEMLELCMAKQKHWF